MTNVSGKFFKAAVLFALVGMGLGIQMAMSGVHDQHAAHAHINLLGWVTLMLFGLFYKSHPEAGQNKLATVHFWLSVLGAVVVNVGVYLLYSGMPEADPIAAIGSLAVISGMACFAVNVYRNA